MLQLASFNVHREFGPFSIPTSQPYALSAVRMYLLDVNSNTLLLNDYAYHETHVIDGEWKQPDSWTNLLNATEGSLRLSIADVLSRLEQSLNTL